jgi:hypothetical protein
MRAIDEGDGAVGRAGWIAGRSLTVTIADLIVRRSVASVRSSRALTLAQPLLRELRSLSPGERARCVIIAVGAALAGHIVLASLLPASASPTVGLTALALLGAGLIAARSAE